MKKIFKDKKRLAVIFSLLGFSLLFISQKQAFFQKTFAQSSLRTCSEIAQGYNFYMCSTMTTTGYGCGPVSDPERNNICYSKIQISQSSDCLSQGKVCRYYNKQTCGTTNQGCNSKCSINGCAPSVVVPTATLTPTPDLSLCPSAGIPMETISNCSSAKTKRCFCETQAPYTGKLVDFNCVLDSTCPSDRPNRCTWNLYAGNCACVREGNSCSAGQCNSSCQAYCPAGYSVCDRSCSAGGYCVVPDMACAWKSPEGTKYGSNGVCCCPNSPRNPSPTPAITASACPSGSCQTTVEKMRGYNGPVGYCSPTCQPTCLSGHMNSPNFVDDYCITCSGTCLDGALRGCCRNPAPLVPTNSPVKIKISPVLPSPPVLKESIKSLFRLLL